MEEFLTYFGHAGSAASIAGLVLTGMAYHGLRKVRRLFLLRIRLPKQLENPGRLLIDLEKRIEAPAPVPFRADLVKVLGVLRGLEQSLSAGPHRQRLQDCVRRIEEFPVHARADYRWEVWGHLMATLHELEELESSLAWSIPS